MNEEAFVPDFSGDDFANDPGIQKSRLEKAAYDAMVQSCVGLLHDKLHLGQGSHRNLHAFLMYKDLTRPTLLRSFRSASSDLYVSIVRYYSAARTARSTYGSEDDYLFGLLTLSKSFPRTMVVRETIREKMADIFTRSEIDFPYSKEFSRRFYVLTENKGQLDQLLAYRPLNDLVAFPSMELEFKEKLCLFRLSRKNISEKETEKFIALAQTLHAVLNGSFLPVDAR